MTQNGRDLLEDDLAHYPLEPGPACPAEAKAQLAGVLPEAFVKHIAANGFCSAAKRRHQFLDPRPFQDLVSRMFKNDPDIDPRETVLVAMDAFGTFSLWSRTHFVMKIDIHHMHLTAPELAPHDFGGMPLPKPAPGLDHLRQDPDNRARGLLPHDVTGINFWDPFNRPVFDLAHKSLGPLEAGEIYAFEPPLVAAGGAIPRHPMDRLRRMQASDALEAAFSIAPLTLVRRLRGQAETLRPVGLGRG